MQLWHAGFESRPQQWRTIGADNLVEQLRPKDAEPPDVDPIAGAEQNTIEHALAGIEIERDAIAKRARRQNRSPGIASDFAEARLEPSGGGRFQASPRKLVAKRSRHVPNCARDFDQPTQRERPDFGGRRHRFTQPAPESIPCGPVGGITEPMNVAAGDDFDFGTFLGEQCCGFASALAAADHRDALAAKHRQIGVGARMACECCWNILERRWPVFLIAQSGGDDDPAGV